MQLLRELINLPLFEASAWDAQEEHTPESRAAKVLAAIKKKTRVGETSKYEIYQPTDKVELDALTNDNFNFEGKTPYYVFVSKGDPKKYHQVCLGSRIIQGTFTLADNSGVLLKDQEAVDFLAQKEPEPLLKCMLYWEILKLPRDRARVLKLTGIEESPTATYELIKTLIKLGYGYAEQISSMITKILAEPKRKLDTELKNLVKVISVQELGLHLDNELKVKLQLAVQKAERTPADKKFDRENDTFIFVGKYKYEEDGHGKFTRKLDIENLYKVDKDDLGDHMAVKMMQTRARMHDAQLYAVNLPKGMFTKKANYASEIPDEILDLIDEHKRKVYQEP